VVCDLTYADLKKINMAAWFGGQFPMQSVLTLDELLDQVGSRTRLLLEVKVNPRARSAEHHRTLMRKLVQTLVTRKMTETTAVLCFELELLAYGHQLSHKVNFVWNQGYARRSDEDGFIAAYSVDFAGLSLAFVEAAHAVGKPVLTFTVNQDVALSQVLNSGVQGVMSDDPAWLCRRLLG
jgi:glycerophosphoryl diester phosphodiesterase